MANTVIGVKNGSSKADFSLKMVQNLIITQKEFMLCYYVIAQDLAQDWVSIVSTTGIPALGTFLYGAICDGLKPGEQTRVVHPVTAVDTILWEVEVHFGTNIREPTDTNPAVNWGGDLADEVQEFDLITRERITTTADEPLFVSRQAFYQTVSIRRLETYPFDDTIPLIYCGTLNATPFYGRPRGTGMMLPIETEETTIDTQRKVWATYTIKFKVGWNFDGTLMEDTWQAHPLNQGYMVRPNPLSAPVKNLDGRGNPIKCNLDSDGVKLTNALGLQLINLGLVPGAFVEAAKMFDTLGIMAQPSDVGSIMFIDSSPITPASPEYLVIGIDGSSWVVATEGDPLTGALYGDLIRAPVYLNFNRGFYREFNALSLGPF